MNFKPFLHVYLSVEKFLAPKMTHRPLLLGYSGGSDSSCLLALLMKVREKFPFDLHLAHVDHGAREESKKQAESLALQAARLGLPFHLHRLSSTPEKNREDFWRQERYGFFKTLFQKYRFEALLLAHHANDQAETLLKRVLEGSFYTHFEGMKKVGHFEDMPVWRPLLEIPKKKIEAFNDKEKISFIDDPMNRDAKYLRPRLRVDIIPELERKFGKNAIENFSALSAQFEKLNHYLDERTDKFFASASPGPLGFCIDFNSCAPLHFIEVEYFLHKFLRQNGCPMPKIQIAQLAQSLCLEKSDHWMEIKNFKACADKGFFFLYKTLAFDWQADFSVEQGASGWPFLWKGAAGCGGVPKGEYSIALPKLTDLCANGKPLGKWYSENKVPVHLRVRTPVLKDKEGLIWGEFLTGRKLVPSRNSPALFPMLKILT